MIERQHHGVLGQPKLGAVRASPEGPGNLLVAMRCKGRGHGLISESAGHAVCHGGPGLYSMWSGGPITSGKQASQE